MVNTDNATLNRSWKLVLVGNLLLWACAQEIWLLASLATTDIVIRHKPGNELILADVLSNMTTRVAKASVVTRPLNVYVLLR